MNVEISRNRNPRKYRLVIRVSPLASVGEALGSTSAIAGTPYQMYQAVTQYIDHERSIRKDTDRWEASVFGSGEAMRQTAFSELFTLTNK